MRDLSSSTRLPNSTERVQKENERISATPFLLWHFSPGDKIENCSAQFSPSAISYQQRRQIDLGGLRGVR